MYSYDNGKTTEKGMVLTDDDCWLENIVGTAHTCNCILIVLCIKASICI